MIDNSVIGDDRLAKQVEETLGLVIESAQKEFFEKGYENASLRTIAQNAGVTTGALYVRFPNKDALFSALVSPVAEAWLDFYRKGEEVADTLSKENRPQDMWAISDEMVAQMVHFIFSNRQDFLLLLDKASGSSYEHFLDDLVDEEVRQTIVFFNGLRDKGYDGTKVSQQDLHVLMSAQQYALFEIVRHDTNPDEAAQRIRTVINFFQSGWQKILGV